MSLEQTIDLTFKQEISDRLDKIEASLQDFMFHIKYFDIYNPEHMSPEAIKQRKDLYMAFLADFAVVKE